jgi:hypothetical protein
MKLSSLAPVGLLAALLPLQPVQAQTSVSFSASYADTSAWPKATAVADFGVDGRPDVVVASRDNWDIRVYQNQGNGSFLALAGALQLTTNPNLPTHSYYLRAGDMDNDGWNDIIAVDVRNKNVLVFRNQGESFGYNTGSASVTVAMSVDTPRNSNTTVTGSSLPTEKVISLALADLNKDGRLDIVAGHREDDSIRVFYNQSSSGSLSFVAGQDIELAVKATPWSLQAADINRDGWVDISVIQTLGATPSALVPGSLRVLFNCSSGYLCPEAGSTALGNWPYELAARDMNGDFKPDLMVANAYSDSLSMLINTTPTGATAASFSVTNYPMGSMPKSLAVGDFNGDCLQDVIVSNHMAHTSTTKTELLTVLLNTPGAAGTFSTDKFPANSIANLQRGNALAQLNSNGDGKLDFVLVSADTNKLISMVNTGSAACR